MELLVAIVVIAGVVVITEGQRNVPVSYAKRIRGNRVFGGVETHLPLRVNQAGGIPIIFAISIILFPGLIGQFLTAVSNPTVQAIGERLIRLLNNQALYGAFYFTLVFLFTYFYTAITFEPHQVAKNLQKNGAFVPGVRPGPSTEAYLGNVITRITFVGALFLGLIAVLPIAMQSLTGITSLALGGTALLIVVQVILDLARRIDAQISIREY